MSAILDVQCHPLLKILPFQVTKTIPETQSLMCSHKYAGKEGADISPTLQNGNRRGVSCGVSQRGRQAATGEAPSKSKHDPSRTAPTTGGGQDLTHC